MSSNVSKVKKFFRNAFKGNKRWGKEYESDVRWKAVLDEDKSEGNEEEKLFNAVGSFPEEPESEENITNISVDEYDFEEASVYVSVGEHESFETYNPKISGGNNTTVKNNCKLLVMDTANVTSIDSDSLICELHDDITHQLNTPEDASHQLPIGEGSRTGREKENSLSKMCYGPELTIDINSAPEVSILSTFVEDIESKLQSPYKTCHAVRNLGNKVKGNKFESASSLDIEKELNDLMGTLCSDLERKGSKRLSNTSKVSNVWESCDDSANGSDRAGGSKINLAFDSEDGSLDDDGPARTTLPDMDNYWANQRMKSTSFSDRYKLGKLMRMGRQRMSMIELRNKVRKSGDYENIRSDFGNPKGFVRCTGSSQEVDYKTDRSAAKMLSNVSLPPVLQSGEESIMKASTGRDMADDRTSQVLGERDEVLSSSRSPSISKQLNDSIDWSWMEEAMNSLNTEYQEPSLERSSSLRVDAGCQTQLDQSWRGEEERMRSRSSSPRVDDSAIGVNNECRIVETRSSSKDMPSKPFVEGGGTSRCSSWLRQSMRRIRHFDLEDPSRIRSAPPDGLRVRSESDSEPTVNSQSAIVNRLTVGNDSQQVLRSGINDIRRTLRSSFSLPRRGAGEGSEVPQQQQQQQEQLHLESETASSSPTTENLDNLGYESDSTDRHPLPRT
ncbi:hypothetical protein RUM43_010716 [Polyplax serrata]|uniref:Uncharacterized protein n=1 Tax=Polyplax serrata TaxID=468196 RepID=A0AAN8Q569_POLSC